MSIRKVCAALVLLLAACGDGSGDTQPAGAASGSPPATADITLLFMGNSHTSANDLTRMVADMVRAGKPGRTVMSVEAPGFLFLDERLNDARSVALLRRQAWSFVILQAQKYSSSGQFHYSTKEAMELVRISREQGAVPVLFPEWPRKDVDETLPQYPVDGPLQETLRGIAAEAVQTLPPRMWCPGDVI